MKQFIVYSFQLIACCLFVVFTNTAKAQFSPAVHEADNFTINEDTLITELRERYIEYNGKKEYIDGYRIQITYTNVRDEVYQGKAAMYRQFPELTSYVEYEQPYYKLRLGDFKTRLEATYYLQQVIPLYPGSFIVKDKIKGR